MGIPHGAPLLLLSPPDPLRWAPAGTPFCPRRLVGTNCISLVPTWRSGLAHSVVPPLQTEPTFVGLRFGLAPPGECVWKNTSCFYAACPTPSVPSGHLPLTGGVGPGPPFILRESHQGARLYPSGAGKGQDTIPRAARCCSTFLEQVLASTRAIASASLPSRGGSVVVPPAGKIPTCHFVVRESGRPQGLPRRRWTAVSGNWRADETSAPTRRKKCNGISKRRADSIRPYGGTAAPTQWKQRGGGRRGQAPALRGRPKEGVRGPSQPSCSRRAQRRSEASQKVLCQAFFQESGGGFSFGVRCDILLPAIFQQIPFSDKKEDMEP